MMLSPTIRVAAAATALSTFGLAGHAVAGDAASLNVLGFSADGSIFAFEEYGTQDGSGFPYANRFYINTADDTFVAGTPVRVRLEDDQASVADARAQAAQQSQSIASDADLANHPGFVAGSNAITELSADTHLMIVNPRPVVPPVDDPLLVRLVEKSFLATGTCAAVAADGATTGFALQAVNLVPGGTVRVLHDDSSVPESRGCPLGYGIGEIRTYHPQDAMETGDPVVATLIAIRTVGFEGPDHRWMAVTAPLLSGSQ